MLTVDLVRCRISKDGTMKLVGQGAKQRPRQLEMAQFLLNTMAGASGATRQSVLELMDGMTLAPNEAKLYAGLKKIVLDHCEFEQAIEIDPEELRAMTWQLAAKAWRELQPQDVFDRMAVLGVVASRFDANVEAVEEALFGDLKNAHRLTKWHNMSAEQLIERYHDAQAQAVFLKAVKVRIRLKPSSAVELRRFFHLLKFRGLLFRVESKVSDEIRLTLDGPISLFSQTSRYGLKLATLIPRLPQFGSGEAIAELSWGKHRRRIQYTHTFKHRQGKQNGRGALNETLDKLVSGWSEKSQWSIEVVTGQLVDVSGRSLVPDLKCEHLETKTVVYLELLGFWSREAVWQRIDMVKSLPTPFVFLVSDRLRVSEKALEQGEHGALFVFKGVINRKRLIEKLDGFLA